MIEPNVQEVRVHRDNLEAKIGPLISQGWQIVHTVRWSNGVPGDNERVIYTFLLVKPNAR